MKVIPISNFTNTYSPKQPYSSQNISSQEKNKLETQTLKQVTFGNRLKRFCEKLIAEFKQIQKDMPKTKEERMKQIEEDAAERAYILSRDAAERVIDDAQHGIS
jgi:hypothetical protein